MRRWAGKHHYRLRAATEPKAVTAALHLPCSAACSTLNTVFYSTPAITGYSVSGGWCWLRLLHCAHVWCAGEPAGHAIALHFQSSVHVWGDRSSTLPTVARQSNDGPGQKLTWHSQREPDGLAEVGCLLTIPPCAHPWPAAAVQVCT